MDKKIKRTPEQLAQHHRGEAEKHERKAIIAQDGDLAELVCIEKKLRRLNFTTVADAASDVIEEHISLAQNEAEEAKQSAAAREGQ